MKIGQKILNEFREGKTPKQLIEEGMNKTSVYKYWKVYQEFEELEKKLWNIIWLSA